MSLAEIEKAVDELSSKELTKLAAYIMRLDRLPWDQEIEADLESSFGSCSKISALPMDRTVLGSVMSCKSDASNSVKERGLVKQIDELYALNYVSAACSRTLSE